jgi:hypothetical protein
MTVVGAVCHEVIGPDVVVMGGPEPDTRPIVKSEPPMLGSFIRNLQPPVPFSIGKRSFSHPQLAAELFDDPSPRQKDLRLTKLPDDLLNAVSLALHPDLPLRSRYCHTLTQNLDHFLGVRSHQGYLLRITQITVLMFMFVVPRFRISL